MKLHIDFVPSFKPGDPPPEGYVAWQEWARVQYRSGRRQTRCQSCLLLCFPQEFGKSGKCLKCENRE